MTRRSNSAPAQQARRLAGVQAAEIDEVPKHRLHDAVVPQVRWPAPVRGPCLFVLLALRVGRVMDPARKRFSLSGNDTFRAGISTHRMSRAGWQRKASRRLQLRAPAQRSPASLARGVRRGPSPRPSILHAPGDFARSCCTTSRAFATCSVGETLLIALTILPSRAMTKVVLSANP